MRTYKLNSHQKSYIKRHLKPMLERHENIKWRGKDWPSDIMIDKLDEILNDKQYDEGQLKLLEDLHLICEYLKRNEP